MTDAQGDTHSLSYNLSRSRTSYTDENGQITYYTFDSNGNVLRRRILTAPPETFTWNSNDLKLSDTNAYGQTESYLYNDTVNVVPNGNVTKFTDRQGNVTDYTYTTDSNPSTVTRESDGATQHYSYYGDGSLEQSVDFSGNVTNYTYPSPDRGLPLSVIAPNGNLTGNYKTWYAYNDAGQTTDTYSPVSTTGAQPNSSDYASLGYIQTSSSYDARGDLTSSTDGNGNTATYTYSTLGRLLTETQPDPDNSGDFARACDTEHL